MSSADQALLNKVIYTSVFIPLLLCGLLIWFLIYYQKKKHHAELQKKEDELRISQLKIERQQALQNERTRIAAEMHDDLGGGLTTIKFLGQKMLRSIDDIEQKRQLDKIVTNSQSLVTNMSEIIWAMNSGFDTLSNLVAYCRRHASEYLSEYDLKLSHQGLETEHIIEVSGEKRRHFFLVFKELLHNIVKHAHAQKVSIHWRLESDEIVLAVKDDGVGMEDDVRNDELPTGNGLRNMKERMTKLGGDISWNTDLGTHTEIRMPLSSQNALVTS